MNRTRVNVIIGITTVLLFLAAAALASQSAYDIQRAVDTIHQIQMSPYAPNGASQLRGVFVNKPNKQGQSAICFQFVAFERYETMFILRPNGNQFLGEPTGWQYLGDRDLLVSNTGFYLPFVACRAGIRIADITADVLAALNPTMTPPSAIKNIADRQKLIDALNAGFKEEKTAAYVEIAGNTLTIHSERASGIRFHQFILGLTPEALDLYKRVEVTIIVYTNDADQKYTYDLTTGHEVKPEGGAQ